MHAYNVNQSGYDYYSECLAPVSNAEIKFYCIELFYELLRIVDNIKPTNV